MRLSSLVNNGNVSKASKMLQACVCVGDNLSRAAQTVQCSHRKARVSFSTTTTFRRQFDTVDDFLDNSSYISNHPHLDFFVEINLYQSSTWLIKSKPRCTTMYRKISHITIAQGLE